MENSIFAPGFIQVNTSKFQLLVLPDQIQFTVNNRLDDDCGIYIKKIIIPLVEKLAGVIFQAVGINFNWSVSEEASKIEKYSADLFYNDQSDIQKHLKTEDSKFGFYISKKVHQTRLKLDVKPVFAGNFDPSEFMMWSFNFHADLRPESNVTELKSILQEWALYSKEAENIIDTL